MELALTVLLRSLVAVGMSVRCAAGCAGRGRFDGAAVVVGRDVRGLQGQGGQFDMGVTDRCTEPKRECHMRHQNRSGPGFLVITPKEITHYCQQVSLQLAQ